MAGAPALDVLGDSGGLLYMGDSGGFARSTTATPNDAASMSADWTASSPSLTSLNTTYVLEPNVTTGKTSDFFPVDRAFPAFATFHTKLYIARNTTNGPQLWKCTPGATGACDGGNWTLTAPNPTGNGAFTQFDGAGRKAISLLIVNGSFLYVGFDDAGGAALFRTSVANPSVASDFTQVGSSLGVTQWVDAVSVAYAGANWLTIAGRTASGTGPLTVFRQRD
jgi:hypothetical protein